MAARQLNLIGGGGWHNFHINSAGGLLLDPGADPSRVSFWFLFFHVFCSM